MRNIIMLIIGTAGTAVGIPMPGPAGSVLTIVSGFAMGAALRGIWESRMAA